MGERRKVSFPCAIHSDSTKEAEANAQHVEVRPWLNGRVYAWTVSAENVCASIELCPFGAQAIKLRPNPMTAIAFFICLSLIFRNRAQSYKICLK